jgi:hypothetical protein
VGILWFLPGLRRNGTTTLFAALDVIEGKVIEWLGRHPRFVFRSIVELQAATNRFIEETNGDPKPFVWTAAPDRVLASVKPQSIYN